MPPESLLTLADFKPGLKLTTGKLTISEEYAIGFAKEYDPQYFHTDPVAAKNSFFGALAVSGWQTAGITMKLIESMPQKVKGGMIGIGLEEVRWPRPVYPGDTVQATIECLGARESRSKPGSGIATLQTETRNQRGELVLEMKMNIWVRKD